MARLGALARLATKLVMFTVFVGWLLVWILRPTRNFSKKFMTPLLNQVTTKAYGTTGGYLLIYAAPMLFLAFVGAIYLECTKSRDKHRRNKWLKVNPWTYPVFSRGPLALISAAELVLLTAVMTLYIWTTSKHFANSFARINVPYMSMPGMPPMMMKMEPRWERKFEIIGGRLGAAGAVPFAFLFFPVARLSPLLRLINIPFEHSVRYHIWTAHTMMFLWSAHSFVYILYWPVAHKSKLLFEWPKTDIGGLSGLLTWIVGLAIWVTSLHPVRKQKFEVFYYTHQLYFVFIVGFALHVGERWLSMMIAGIFLFFIDRFLRFLQSRKHVDVVSARMISGETMELKFAKAPSLEYPPASSIFLNIPAVSRLQWHPFTVTSCSNVDTDHVSVVIKSYGKWTERLREILLQQSSHPNGQLRLEAAIEGPYGHGPEYLDTYKMLLFVAGGSGISPFISIIKELVYRAQMKKLQRPLEKVSLVWCVKKSEELRLIDSVCAYAWESELNLEVHAYVTREEAPDVEASKTAPDGTIHFASGVTGSSVYAEPSSPEKSLPAKASFRALTGTFSYGVYAAVLLASFAGYMLLSGVILRYYIDPIDHNSYAVYSRSARGFLSLLEYMVGICVFGGITAFLWNSTRGMKKAIGTVMTTPEGEEKTASSLGHQAEVHFGHRPDFRAIVASYQDTETGVFVCGPEGMLENLAELCKDRMLNFHSLYYEL